MNLTANLKFFLIFATGLHEKNAVYSMKELIFIRDNIDRWEYIEHMTGHLQQASPDDIAEAYTAVTADLAFAYTHYPSSRVTLYLNNLASTLHNGIYANKRERLSRLVTFWTREVPLTMYDERHTLLAAFLIFAVSVAVGVVSQTADHDFCRIILGNGYVDMTLRNIAAGKPMAVYGGGPESDMFLAITFNNVWVAFRIFAAGLASSLFTAVMLFYNSVMFGCFEAFFAQHGLLGESLLAVLLHGTLELSAIIVAGAAGLAMGNSWLFPGTYPRLYAFRRGAKRGLKIAVGTVPIFVVAGFIEGFVTRHTEIADPLRLSFILLSLTFVVTYFAVLPHILGKRRDGSGHALRYHTQQQ